MIMMKKRKLTAGAKDENGIRHHLSSSSLPSASAATPSVSKEVQISPRSKNVKNRLSVAVGIKKSPIKLKLEDTEEDEDYSQYFSEEILKEIQNNYDEEFGSSPQKVINQEEPQVIEQLVKKIFYDEQKRFIIEEFVGLTKNDQGYIYKAKSESSGENCTLLLNDYWNTPSSNLVGYTVNIVNGLKQNSNTIEINKESGYLIVSPDYLVPITSIIDSLMCSRRAVYNDRVKFGGCVNLNMLRGNIAHEMTQMTMLCKLSSRKDIKQLAEEAIHTETVMNAAYALNISHTELSKLADDLITPIEIFMKRRFLTPSPEQKWEILELCDIEETHWSPTYGIKGKIDAAVQIRERENGIKEIIPLELKTGREPKPEDDKKNSKSSKFNDYGGFYVAQLSLYNLLMEHLKDRNDGSTNKGIVYTIRDDGIFENESQILKLKQLIHKRNMHAISTQLDKKTGLLPNLPTAICDSFFCSSCPVYPVCALEIRSRKSGAVNSNTETVVKSLIDHLSEEECIFFDNQIKFLFLEMSVHKDETEVLWKVDPFERMQNRNCLAGLKYIHQSSGFENKPGSSGSSTTSQHDFHLTLFLDHPKAEDHLKNTLIVEKDFVSIGTNQEACIGYSYVYSVNEKNKTVTLILDNSLSSRHTRSDVSFTIDKNTRITAMKTLPGYIVQVLYNTENARKIRAILMGKVTPIYPADEAKNKNEKVLKILKKFNPRQRSIIVRSLSMDTFLFVKGMPGTGKTETIVGLIRAILANKQTALVVSYTNSALNNILLKLESYYKDFIRIGHDSAHIDQVLKKHLVSESIKNCKNVDEVKAIYDSKVIVGATLLNLNHELFVRRRFTYLIVDECSQAIPASIYGSMLLADKYIFFGDPDQLPAIVISEEAKKMGLPSSLFDMFSNATNTLKLKIQYRMNEPIMSLMNKIVYNDQMLCGSEAQKLKSLHIDSLLRTKLLAKVKTHCSLNTRRILTRVTSSNAEFDSVLFFDTSELGNCEKRVSTSISNILECKIVISFIQALIKSGVPSQDIGIIAPYRAQVHQAKETLKLLGNTRVEVNTVDQFQGRDKEIIICTFTKTKSTVNICSDLKESIGHHNPNILDDIRRLNVAMTRAKTKLILVGNREILESTSEPFRKLFNILKPEVVEKISPTDIESLSKLIPSSSNSTLKISQKID